MLQFQIDTRASLTPVVADGMEGGLMTPGEPQPVPHFSRDQFDVAPAFQFQPARGAHAVEVAVDIDFQQQSRGIRRGAALVRPDVDEAEFFQVDGVHKGVHDAHQIVRGDQFVQWGSEKAELLAVLSGAVGHAVLVGGAAGRRWLKDSSLGWLAKRGRGFFHNLTLRFPNMRRLGAIFWKRLLGDFYLFCRTSVIPLYFIKQWFVKDFGFVESDRYG